MCIRDRYIDDGKIQGAVIAVSRKNKPVYFSAHGLADVPNKIAMRKDSMFQMWSSTKPVLGVAAMIAIEKDLFKPEDEVSKYLPKFKDIEVAVLNNPKTKIYPRWGSMRRLVIKIVFSQIFTGEFGLGSMMDTTLDTSQSIG